MFRSGLVVRQVHALQRQAVAGERVRGFVGYKLFQSGAARFLTFGPLANARIITGSAMRAKRALIVVVVQFEK